MTYPDGGEGVWNPRQAQQRPEDAEAQPEGDAQQQWQAQQQWDAYQAAALPHPGPAPQAALPPPPPLTMPTPGPAAEARPQVVIARAKVAPVGARPAEPVADPTTDATGRRLAAPAVTSAPLASPHALVAADGLVADRSDDSGPPSDGAEQAAAQALTGPSGKMARLHVGWHSVSRGGLRGVTATPSTAGLIVGHDRQHSAVPVRLFAPEPVRVTLVGGVWAAQLLIFRAFALGARVTVVTTEPTVWIGFGERATGQYNRLTVLSGDQAAAAAGTAQQPMLAVYDLGATGPVSAPPLGPWRTQLTILRQLDRPGVPALQEADLTLLQRLGGDEATLATTALRLRQHSGQFLQFMADDMMALIGEGTDRYLSLGQTGVEQEHVGLPRR